MSKLNVNQQTLLDGDSAYKAITGAARVRYVPGSGEVLLQISQSNGDSTYSVATFKLPGALRDVLQSPTQWPTYQAQDSFHDVQTTTTRDNAEVLASNGEVPGGDGVPVSASTSKAGS